MGESSAGNTGGQRSGAHIMYDPVRCQKEDAFRYFVFLVAFLVAATGAFVSLSLYERSMLGEYRLGIGSAPYYTPYYLGRLLVAFLLALAFVAGIHRLSDPESPFHLARLHPPSERWPTSPSLRRLPLPSCSL